MRHRGELPRRRMIGRGREVARLAHRAGGGVGMGEHEPREAPGERRFADPFATADQPGVREPSFAIRAQHFGLGGAMADEPRGRLRMRGALEQVAFRRRLGWSLAHFAFASEGRKSAKRPADDVPDRLRDLVLAPGRVDHGAALGLLARDPQERVTQRLVEREPLALEAIGSRLPASALGGALQALLPPANRGSMSGRAASDPTTMSLETRDELGVELARRALIGPGRIGETVADDPIAARQGWFDRHIDMVDARGGKQQRLAGRAVPGGLARKNDLRARLPRWANRRARASRRHSTPRDFRR